MKNYPALLASQTPGGLSPCRVKRPRSRSRNVNPISCSRCETPITAPSHLRQRAAVILLAFDGLRNEDIAAEVGLGRRQVGRWRRRWAKAWSGLIDLECPRRKPTSARPSKRCSPTHPRPRRLRQVHPGASHPDPRGRLRAPREVGPAHHPLDGPRTGRRGRQAGHRHVDLDVPGEPLPPRGRPAAPQEPVLADTTEKDPVQFQKQVERSATRYLGRSALEREPRIPTPSASTR